MEKKNSEQLEKITGKRRKHTVNVQRQQCRLVQRIHVGYYLVRESWEMRQEKKIGTRL